MTPQTKQEIREIAAAFRDPAKYPDSTLANLIMLYTSRDDKVMAGLVRAELAKRQMESGRLPLGEATLFDEGR